MSEERTPHRERNILENKMHSKNNIKIDIKSSLSLISVHASGNSLMKRDFQVDAHSCAISRRYTHIKVVQDE